jgi:TolA-binding protein
MKVFTHITPVFCFLMGAVIFSACAPIVEKPPQNDFFEPVNRIAHKKTGSDTLTLTYEIPNAVQEDFLKDSMIVLYRQQNKQLNEMIRQLNLLTKNYSAGSPKDTSTTDEILAKPSELTNEMLLEKIKNQNQRLHDVNAQFKLLTQNQLDAHPRSSESVNVVPAQPAIGQQVPVLITGANAVPAKPLPKIPVQRSVGPSLNYTKALDMYKSQQYGKAIDAFEKLLSQKIDPYLSDRYHFWMGVCYLNVNKSDQAMKEFTSVLGYSRSEKLEEAYFMIGQCYERTGAHNAAKTTYQKMLQLFPQGNLKQAAEKKLALLK